MHVGWYDGRQSFDKMQYFNLMMNNLNEDYTPFSMATMDQLPSKADMDQTIKDMLKVHVLFWESPRSKEAPFCATSDGTFGVSPDEVALTLQLGEYYPRMKKGFTKHSNGKLGPLFAADCFAFDITAGDGGNDGKIIYKEAMRRLRKAPMTIVHGDMNPGNVWKSRTSDSLCYADWQVTRQAPAAWEFVTLTGSVESEAPCFHDFEELLHAYYSGLKELLPKVCEKYSYAKFEEHFKCSYMCFMQWIMRFLYSSIVEAAESGAMDKAKMEFTFGVFMYNFFKRQSQITKQVNMRAYAEELLAAGKEFEA